MLDTHTNSSFQNFLPTENEIDFCGPRQSYVDQFGSSSFELCRPAIQARAPSLECFNLRHVLAGLHRYVLLVYEQPGNIEVNERLGLSPANRPSRKVKDIASQYKLGSPVAGACFQAEWDEYVPKLMAKLKWSSTPPANYTRFVSAEIQVLRNCSSQWQCSIAHSFSISQFQSFLSTAISLHHTNIHVVLTAAVSIRSAITTSIFLLVVYL